MKLGFHIQNLVLLAVATGLSLYFRNGWGFFLLGLWVEPKSKCDDSNDEKS